LNDADLSACWVMRYLVLKEKSYACCNLPNYVLQVNA